jgi:hypothetical protein
MRKQTLAVLTYLDKPHVWEIGAPAPLGKSYLPHANVWEGILPVGMAILGRGLFARL